MPAGSLPFRTSLTCSYLKAKHLLLLLLLLVVLLLVLLVWQLVSALGERVPPTKVGIYDG